MRLSIRGKSILTLAFITFLLTELLTSNQPLSKIFLPHIFIILVFAYSFPIILIREATIRWKLNISGIVILGLAYGILNEGILAKTFHYPAVEAFNYYSPLFGINPEWTAVITLWHSLHSTLYPILLVHFFYASASREQWLRNKTVFVLLFITAAFAIIFFFLNLRNVAAVYLLVYIAAMVILVFLARLNVRQGELDYSAPPNIKAFFWGILFAFLAILTAFLLAEKKIGPVIFFIYFLSVLSIFYLVVKKRNYFFQINNLVLFALGDYFVSAAVPMLARRTAEVVVTGVIFEIVFLIVALKIIKNKSDIRGHNT